MQYNETPNVKPIRPAYRQRVLGDDQLSALKAGTLQILAEVGVHCPSRQAMQIYADHGAQVDFNSQVVRLPPEIVLSAMSHAPRNFTLGARKESHDIHLDGLGLYCATDGCGVEVIDFATRQRRPSCKDDIAKTARIADYLSSIGFYWPMVSAQDFPKLAPLHELDASFNNTIKHVQTETVMSATMARHALEMALVIAGDEDTLRKRPLLSSLICTIAPLAQDEGGMEAALVFAQAGLPVGFMSMACAGSTAPATVAGTLVVADAEIVAAMVLIQLAFPGAPVYHSLMPGIMQPRTGGYLTTAWEGEILYPAGVELAHMWGVPELVGVFGTDALVPGWQSAAESTACLLLCAMCGADIGSGLGLLESCTLLYPEAIVLDADIYHKVRILAAGLDTSPAELALDVIREVGPRGHYLSNRHTLQNLGQLEFSELTAQPGQTEKFHDPIQLALEKVNWILKNHVPEPLPDTQMAELKRILQTAQSEMH